MDIMTLIGLLQTVPVFGPVLPYIPLICGVCAILDAAMPQPPAGSPWVIPRKVISALAINFGNARNAVPAGAVPAAVAAKADELVAAVRSTALRSGELLAAVDGTPEAAVRAAVIRPVIVPCLALLVALGATACTRAQLVSDGQLACAIGPTIVAVSDVAGVPVLAQGASAAFVQAVCAALEGVPVAPPPAPLPVAVVRLP